MVIKCACGDPACKTSIRIGGGEGGGLMFTDKAGNETLMYIDANTVATIVSELRRYLNDMVFGRQGAG